MEESQRETCAEHTDITGRALSMVGMGNYEQFTSSRPEKALPVTWCQISPTENFPKNLGQCWLVTDKHAESTNAQFTNHYYVCEECLPTVMTRYEQKITESALQSESTSEVGEESRMPTRPEQSVMLLGPRPKIRDGGD